MKVILSVSIRSHFLSPWFSIVLIDDDASHTADGPWKSSPATSRCGSVAEITDVKALAHVSQEEQSEFATAHSLCGITLFDPLHDVESLPHDLVA